MRHASPMTLDVPSVLDERELRVAPLERAHERERSAPARASDRWATREPVLASAAAPALEDA